MEYKVISTDDHLQEPRDLWTRRMSKQKWGDRIPEVRRMPDGADSWFMWDEPHLKYGKAFLGNVTGVTEGRRYPITWEDVPLKSYVPAERIKAMAQDGVDVHAFFGNVVGVAGNTFSDTIFPDEKFRMECIQAYNDFQIDEFATPYPGRFITLADLPMWNVEAAVSEARRMAKRGVKGLSFAFPQQFGYPHVADRHWDPLWAFAQEAKLSVNFHIGSGASMGMQGTAAYNGNPLNAQVAERATRVISANVDVMTTIIFSGIMERFPGLIIVSSESGLGWVPYLLETADHHWQKNDLAHHGLPLKPSDYFRRQVYVNFWFESVGLRLVKETVGLDNVMWSSDYPHPTSTWPDSRSYIERSIAVAGLNAQEQRKVLVDNARKVFHL